MTAIQLMTTNLKRGDHVCFIYSTPAELAEVVAEFISDGLRPRQRCWYVAAGNESGLVRAALQQHHVDVDAETRRGALRVIDGREAYVVRGSFNPEASIKVFNDAIEQACSDGFTGVRAAADMSWALQLADGATQLIVYEALLRSLFSNCRAIGLCLYDRNRMPLNVIDGALATHPKVRSGGNYSDNRFYDARRSQLTSTPEALVRAKLRELDGSTS